MQRLMELAGFMAAHGMWSFDDDGALTPFPSYEMADGSRGLVRFVDESLDAGVASGHGYLDGNLQGAAMAVMVSDGSYTAEGELVRALIIEGKRYAEPLGALTIAVPYRPADDASRLDILFPELLQYESTSEPFDLLAAFFEGVDSHGPAGEHWAESARFSRERVA